MIENKNFLAVEYMPPMENIADIILWMTENEPMRYIFDRVRKMLIYDPDTQNWRGHNYGKSERLLLSEAPRIHRNTRTIYRNAEEVKLDLLEPTYSHVSYITHWEDFRRGELIQQIASKQKFIRLFFIWACSQGAILKTDDGFWAGSRTRNAGITR
ncbi:hypothetical protein BU200_05630 [Streptococcus acidominimus]|uniref:Uncharacterized protein n=1 Tax=Streptococcus acidominimus TaxID=1326 RepID=A0A1Q8ED64_STRAI|nr:hypothetical protein BU200_05630 [Streptococcus acidominimus]SUN06024.1 Uncharacterised protein [Streptococcus acidominimus]